MKLNFLTINFNNNTLIINFNNKMNQSCAQYKAENYVSLIISALLIHIRKYNYRISSGLIFYLF